MSGRATPLVKQTASSEHSDPPAIKFAFFGAYFLFFLGIGALLPYLYLFLRDARDMSPIMVGLATLLAPLAVMVAQPLWGSLGDLTGRPVLIIQVASLLVSLTAVVMWQELYYGWYFLLVPLFFVLQSAIDPLINAAVVRDEQQTGRQGEFGKKRLWGSVGFIAGNLLAAHATHSYGLDIIFPVYSVAMLLLMLQAFALRGIKTYAVGFSEMLGGLKRAVKTPAYMWLVVYLIVWGIPFGGNSVAFGWYWADIGGTERGLGYIWFLAAVFEIPLYYLTVHFKQKISFRFLLLLSACMAVLRWLIYLLLPVPWLLYFVQPLHAIMFVSLSVGSVYLIDMLSDPVIRSTGQAVLAAAIYGLGAAIGNLSAGIIYQLKGPEYFYGFLIICNLCCILIMIKISRIGQKNDFAEYRTGD